VVIALRMDPAKNTSGSAAMTALGISIGKVELILSRTADMRQAGQHGFRAGERPRGAIQAPESTI
jgi:hypothetical protein